MNHKWSGNVCLNCGITREKKTLKTLMAIVNHPPWEAYKYQTLWHYSKGEWKRPECVPTLHPGIGLPAHGIEEKSLPF